jgi:Peptidase A4 family
MRMNVAGIRKLGVAAALSVSPLLAAPAVGAAGPAISHPARAALPTGTRMVHSASRHATWAASNWSGYAESGTFTGVSGIWTVPSVAPSSTATYSSAWIGVDGFTNSSLIQTGTEEDYYNGAAHYNAWWEILPAAETAISTSSYPVSPGDRMSASIYETSATVSVGRHRSEHVWAIKIADQTSGWTFTTNQAYGGPGSSAEWILEAPSVNGQIAPLAHYTVNPPAGYGDFDNAGVLSTITTSGASPTYKSAGLNYSNDSGVMIQNNIQVSTPGNPDAVNTAFNVAYGSSLPATPAG